MTTSTSSAGATGLPDRRSFLSTFTAAGALGLGASLPVVCAAAHPDAELIKLDALLAAAEARSDELETRCDEVYDAGYEPPPMPEALFWRRSDFPAVWIDKKRLDSVGFLDGTERYTYASEDVPKNLRETAAAWHALPPLERSFNERCLARVEEIIAAIEAWQAEEAQRLTDCGYTAAAEAARAQRCIVDELQHRIARRAGSDVGSREHQGLCGKARNRRAPAIAACRDPRAAEPVLERDPRDAPPLGDGRRHKATRRGALEPKERGMKNQTLTRRSLVAAAPAAIVAAALPALAAGSHLDAELLALREPFYRTWRAYEDALAVHSAAEGAAWSLRRGPDDDPKRRDAERRHDEADAIVESTGDANREIVDEMCRRPARTIEGLAFKARVSLDHEDNLYPELVTSIMDDIVALGGAHA